MAKGELVKFTNSNDVELDGILFREENNTTTVVHVHGSYGNFYQNRFLALMADRYLHANLNFLSFNLVSHDGFAEGYQHIDEFEYVGGAIQDFEECISDIEGAIAFVRNFSSEIVLQGHSLGCDRILHYLISKKSRIRFILLSPCDSYQLQCNWIHPEKVEDQITRLRREDNSTEFDWLPTKEYGIKQGEWTYVIPVTRKAALSIMDGPPFKLMNMSRPSTFYLPQESLVYIGGRDSLQTVSSEIMFKYLAERISSMTRAYFVNGDHNFAGCENELIETIVEWLKKSTTARPK